MQNYIGMKWYGLACHTRVWIGMDWQTIHKLSPTYLPVAPGLSADPPQCVHTVVTLAGVLREAPLALVTPTTVLDGWESCLELLARLSIGVLQSIRYTNSKLTWMTTM
jgi:hypothetical protein